jgi:hypothetical protein
MSGAQDSTTGHGQQTGLSRAELQRLTMYKWHYSLGSLGFKPHEVQQLVFLTWLRATRRVFG